MLEGKTVIKFGAHWCPPCVKLGPVLEMMAEKYKTFTFVDIDVDEQFAEELGEKFGISSIPDVLLFDNGK